MLIFGCAIGDQDEHWALHFCCVNCTSRLHRWFAGKNVSLGFAVPMVWREQKDHVTDCYFCLTNIQGHSHKTRKNTQYPDLPSVIRPVQHYVDLLIPMPPASPAILDEKSLTYFESSGVIFEPCQSKGIPHLITQEDLNNLVRDLNLSKSKSELLGSRLQLWNLPFHGTKVSFKSLSVYLTSFLQMVSFAIVMTFLHCLKALI